MVAGGNCDAAAKRPGQRRKEATAAVTPGHDREANHARPGVHQRRDETGAESSSPLLSPRGRVVPQSSIETRRARAVKRGQSQYAGGVHVGGGTGLKGGGVGGAEGHVEAASGVAQLSLHSSSSSTAARDTRQP